MNLKITPVNDNAKLAWGGFQESPYTPGEWNKQVGHDITVKIVDGKHGTKRFDIQLWVNGTHYAQCVAQTAVATATEAVDKMLHQKLFADSDYFRQFVDEIYAMFGVDFRSVLPAF